MERMRVGVIGTGGMGNVHSRHWQRIEGVDLFAFDTDHEKLTEFCGKYNAGVCSSFEQLLDCVDAVDICLPTYLHRGYVLEAISAGKGVLVEKPMGRNVNECRDMIRAAEQAGTFLSVAHVARCFPEHKKVHELVKSGAVGTPASVRMRRGGGMPKGSGLWFSDYEKSGGVLLDLAIHEFDWLLWTLGDVTQVFSRSVRMGEKRVEAEYSGDYALTTLSFASGAVAHVESTWMDPSGFRTILEVSGNEGIIEFDSRAHSTLITHTADGSQLSSLMDAGDDPYFLQLSAFKDAFVAREEPPVSGLEGLRAVAVAEAAIESAKTGRPVTPELE